MIFDNLCPKVLSPESFFVKDALHDVADELTQDIRQFPDWLKEAAKYIEAGNYNSKSVERAFKKVRNNIAGSINTKLLSWNRESCTLVKQEIDITGIIHPSRERYISIPEFKRLTFFPDEYNFIGKRKEKVARIGNSIPPGFMRSIAMNINNHLFSGQTQSSFPKYMSYLEILEATWQEHLVPKEENAPTVISTFAGCGGSSLGYSMAGFKELLAIEWNDNAVETFKLNFPDIPVYHGDIAELSVEKCMELAGLMKSGELDVLDGSPPCQGFSTAGKRQMKDTRNTLFHEFTRLLQGLQPKAFIMENVSGMVKGKMKLIFADILRELKASGYIVKCWLLNAKYFYVPQSRERLFFIGVQEDYWQECLKKDSLTSL